MKDYWFTKTIVEEWFFHARGIQIAFLAFPLRKTLPEKTDRRVVSQSGWIERIMQDQIHQI